MEKKTKNIFWILIGILLAICVIYAIKRGGKSEYEYEIEHGILPEEIDNRFQYP